MQGIKRRHLSIQAWQELFQRHAESSEPIGTFCRREGVSTHSYRRWKARLGEQTPTAALTPVSVARATKMKPVSPAPFVDLGSLATPPSSPARLELRLELGGGVTLHVVRG